MSRGIVRNLTATRDPAGDTAARRHRQLFSLLSVEPSGECFDFNSVTVRARTARAGSELQTIQLEIARRIVHDLEQGVGGREERLRRTQRSTAASLEARDGLGAAPI
jgi:hypothetical protein